MSNTEKVRQVKKLIDEINGNTTVSRGATKADLEDIQEHLEILIDSLAGADKEDEDDGE